MTMSDMGNILVRFDKCGILEALVGELDYQAFGPTESALMNQAAQHENTIRTEIEKREAECAKMDSRIITLKTEAVNLKSRASMQSITKDGRMLVLQRLKKVMQNLAVTQQQLQTQRTFVDQGHATLQKIAVANRVKQDTEYVTTLNSATQFAKLRTGDAELNQMGAATDELLENDSALDSAHDVVRDTASALQRAMDSQPVPEMEQMSFSLNDEKDLLAAVSMFEEEFILSQPSSVYMGANTPVASSSSSTATSSSYTVPLNTMPAVPAALLARTQPRVAVALTSTGTSVGVRQESARARRERKNDDLNGVF